MELTYEAIRQDGIPPTVVISAPGLLRECSAIFAGAARRRTPETGVYFTQPPRRNPIARVWWFGGIPESEADCEVRAEKPPTK